MVYKEEGNTSEIKLRVNN